MGKHVNPTRVAGRGTAAYAAGEYLYKNGAMPVRELFAAVDLGRKSTPKDEALQRALTYGWLIERNGKIDISPSACAHFNALAGVEVVTPVGQIAAPRQPVDVFARPPLSKKYIPNPRGTRHDVPAWSVRDKASFKNLGGGEA